MTFQEYRIADHAMKPQIFIFPVKDLAAVNTAAGQTAATLQTLITSPQEIPDMPFLPQMNMVQMMHANIQYLDFKTGQGLRYLTEFAQGPVPFNNHDLIYTYQGLTSDGRYYVAAILPINHSFLPADSTITGNEPLEFTSDPAAYKANVITTLTRDVDFFFPLLTELDAMIASMEIK